MKIGRLIRFQGIWSSLTNTSLIIILLTESGNAFYLQWKLLQYDCMFKCIVHGCDNKFTTTKLNMFLPYIFQGRYWTGQTNIVSLQWFHDSRNLYFRHFHAKPERSVQARLDLTNITGDTPYSNSSRLSYAKRVHLTSRGTTS